MNTLARINEYFKECFENSQTFVTAQKSNDIDTDIVNRITRQIPNELTSYINDRNYIVDGSVGKGLAAKTPWVAILDKEITKSTRSGVYIVFLFSSDYKHVYLTLNQGTTVPGQFGARLKKKVIIERTLNIRNQLNIENDLLLTDGKANITDKLYLAGAIFYSEWDVSDNERCNTLLQLYLDIYKRYKSLQQPSQDKEEKEGPVIIYEPMKPDTNKSFSIKNLIEEINKTGLIYSPKLIKRFAFSLLTKPFVILSGLAGSGKTQLAITFAKALVDDVDKQMRIVSVGADWTNREPLLGFPNALQQNKYVTPESQVLELLIEADKPENCNKPFFLILDEMNMSYVERYFADFLSAMESEEAIPLWKKDKQMIGEKDVKWDNIPEKIKLPSNLFIIGTINVDETTYMFSPKVLDRANVIEFKISVDEMAGFLNNMKEVHSDDIKGKAAKMAADFVKRANIKKLADNKDAVKTLNSFFRQLKNVNAEFGYRSATEIFRFICQAQANDDTDTKMEIEEILDAAVVQKLLPKLHGSRKKLDPVLKQLWRLCFETANTELPISSENVAQAKFKESADKIWRMYESAIANGFTSFAEA